MATKTEDKENIEFLRAANLERQKKYDEAEATFRKILNESPDNAAVLNYLGYMLADHGDKLDDALAMIKKAVDQEPANGAYLDSLGWAYFKLGKYDLAEDNLTKASQHMGADPTVQEHLGDLYQKTGRLKLAATHWERAVEEWGKTVAPEVDQEEQAQSAEEAGDCQGPAGKRTGNQVRRMQKSEVRMQNLRRFGILHLRSISEFGFASAF